MRTKAEEKPERDFYENVISVMIDDKAKSLYIVSETDPLKGLG